MHPKNRELRQARFHRKAHIFGFAVERLAGVSVMRFRASLCRGQGLRVLYIGVQGFGFSVYGLPRIAETL